MEITPFIKLLIAMTSGKLKLTLVYEKEIINRLHVEICGVVITLSLRLLIVMLSGKLKLTLVCEKESIIGLPVE